MPIHDTLSCFATTPWQKKPPGGKAPRLKHTRRQNKISAPPSGLRRAQPDRPRACQGAPLSSTRCRAPSTPPPGTPSALPPSNATRNTRTERCSKHAVGCHKPIAPLRCKPVTLTSPSKPRHLGCMLSTAVSIDPRLHAPKPLHHPNPGGTCLCCVQAIDRRPRAPTTTLSPPEHRLLSLLFSTAAALLFTSRTTRTLGSSLALLRGADADLAAPAVRKVLATLPKGCRLLAQRCASSKTTQQADSGSIHPWSSREGGERERETGRRLVALDFPGGGEVTGLQVLVAGRLQDLEGPKGGGGVCGYSRRREEAFEERQGLLARRR